MSFGVFSVTLTRNVIDIAERQQTGIRWSVQEYQPIDTSVNQDSLQKETTFSILHPFT